MQLLVSSQWWILVAATVGVTLTTFMVWWYLRKRGRHMIKWRLQGGEMV